MSPTVTFFLFRFQLHMRLMTSPLVPQLLSSLALSSPCWWPPSVQHPVHLVLFLPSVLRGASLYSQSGHVCCLSTPLGPWCGFHQGIWMLWCSCRAGRGNLHQVPWGFCCILGPGPTWAGGCYGRWELGSCGQEVQRGAQLARWLRAGIAAGCPLLGGAVPACHWGCWAGH